MHLAWISRMSGPDFVGGIKQRHDQRRSCRPRKTDRRHIPVCWSFTGSVGFRRLAVFRDDLIFLIFLYQRYIYPIDKQRPNEFGCGHCWPHPRLAFRSAYLQFLTNGLQLPTVFVKSDMSLYCLAVLTPQHTAQLVNM